MSESGGGTARPVGRFALALVAFSVAAGTASGEAPADPVAAEVGLSRGVMAFERGRYAEALGWLAVADPAGPTAAPYYRGLCLLALQRPREALAEFDAVRRAPGAPAEASAGAAVARSRVIGPSDDPLPRFEPPGSDPAGAPADGLVRQLNGTSARPDALPGQAAGLARPTLNGVAGPPADRRWNLAVLGGYEYDTDVALAPGVIPLGLGANGHRRDSRSVVASFGEYRLVQRQAWVLGLIGSTYDSFQYRLDRYNVQDYMGGVYSNVALTGDLILGGRYEFHETLLAGRQFLTEHRFTPNLTYREGSFGHLTAFYEYDPIHVTGLALIPAQVRTGNINAVGLTEAVYLFEGAGRFYAGYRYEQAETRGSDFDRSTHMLDARFEVPLPFKVVANAEARVFFDDYRNPNSLDFLGRRRQDQRVEARAGFQKFFTDHLSMRVDYIYTNNHSNVRNLFGQGFYSYDRNVFSALLIYDF